MRARSGLEVEFNADNGRDDVLERLENQGLEAQIEDYNHQTRDYWKVTTDSSCGYELVSPPLSPDLSKTIAPAMQAVTQAGGYVNDRCGFHVHIEMPEDRRSMRDGLIVAGLYHDAYEFISPLFPANRTGTANRFTQFFEVRDEFLSRIAGDRYMAVNIQCLNRQPTIEFRQHEGTLSPKRAYAWMSLCDTLTTTALEGGDLDKFIRRLRYDAPGEVTDELQARGVAI